MRSLIRPAVAAIPTTMIANSTMAPYEFMRTATSRLWDAPEHVLRAVRGLDGVSLRKYPGNRLRDVSCRLARRLGTSSDQLVIGNGADDILGALGRAVLDPADVVVTVSPTFGMYARIASIAGAELRTLPYTQRWELDTDALLRLSAEAKLVILGHPNNPTGDTIDERTLAELARALPRALIVVDEVYLSLSADSLVPRAGSFPNVAVVGSFSKVAALAGMRIGYAVAHPLIACAFRCVMPPFPISVASLAAVDAYIGGGTATDAFETALTTQTRRSLDTIVDEVGCFAENVWRGCGNFVLMDFGAAGSEIAEALRTRGTPCVRSPSRSSLDAFAFAPSTIALPRSSWRWYAPLLLLPAREACMRSGKFERVTAETIVSVTLDLDGPASREIATGMPMLDHLLDQLAFYSGCGAAISARSLDAIQHHLIEDTAIVFGRGLNAALGDRRGIARFGSAVIPMDDALARAAIDLGGRSYSRVELPLTAEHVEGLEVAMIPHFFHSIAFNSGMTVHVDLLYGKDPHHAIEACFKAFARACQQAWSRTSTSSAIA